MTKILVCGGRDYDDWRKISSALEHYFGVYRGIPPEGQTVITGDACGADWLARAWAKYTGRDYEGYPADWKTYGKSAGPIRNQQMLDEGKPDLVLVFPGDTGTGDMAAKAKKAGVEVVEIG